MVALAVNNLEKSVQFYRDGLKLPMLDSPPGVAFFNLNGTWLGLSKREDLANDAGVASEGSGYSGINLAHNVASKEEVTEVLSEAIEAGGVLIKEAQQASWGGFHGYFSDPDGHLWEVAYNPFAWVGPED
jgi:catechol 2,3-dioxygenase-like lactoylglutathione lyase family enzyme